MKQWCTVATHPLLHLAGSLRPRRRRKRWPCKTQEMKKRLGGHHTASPGDPESPGEAAWCPPACSFTFWVLKGCPSFKTQEAKERTGWPSYLPPSLTCPTFLSSHTHNSRPAAPCSSKTAGWCGKVSVKVDGQRGDRKFREHFP